MYINFLRETFEICKCPEKFNYTPVTQNSNGAKKVYLEKISEFIHLNVKIRKGTEE
jgi:hypothetical protein